MDMGTIAAQVRTWRVRRGLTQQQFADALGRHVTWVKKFEAGDRQADPRLSLLVQIGQVLDVTLDVLLGQSDAVSGSQASAMSSGDLRAALLRPVADDRPQNTQALSGRTLGRGHQPRRTFDDARPGRDLPPHLDHADEAR
jgi:transcriptional regulator with XRE-family HTH domain